MKKNHLIKFILLTFVLAFIYVSCKKESETQIVESSVNLAIDSIVASKTNIVIWEKIKVQVYTKGENLKYLWQADHGSMIGKDSCAITYWACPSCIGLNTIKCTVSNDYGSILDTIKINVSDDKFNQK
jgi:hypothetical protein